MQVSCPNCRARYAVDPQAIGQTGRTVQCVRCNHRWFETVAAPVIPPLPPAPLPTPPTATTPLRQVHWGRWLAAAMALVLSVGVGAFTYRDELGSGLRSDWRATVPSAATARPRLQLVPVMSKLEFVDGRYMVRGELYNAGGMAASSTVLRLVFRKGNDVLAERLYPLIEGPLAPGGRLAFVRELEDPPDGTTDVVPAIE